MAEKSDPGGTWAGQQNNILVAVRVRPLLKHDRVHVEVSRVLDSKVIVLLDPHKVMEENDPLRVHRSRERRYAFDYVFDTDETQQTVYENTTRFLIRGVLGGFNATVFAYGCTGAGKTHTMIGSPQDPGIMMLTLQDLFKEQERVGEEEGQRYKVKVSFLEVYNENIRDLLSDVDENLDLREDPIKGPVVAGILEVEARSAEEVMDLLHRGNRNRTMQATHANAVSSRSHAVLQVTVESRERAAGTVARVRVGKLSLVDLAGSERAAKTENRGQRLVEGANINRSLLALGNCINALGEKGNRGQFVPYRDSKLTRLLKDSLGGNCRTVMIANVSSSAASFEETLNTLKYANRAKNIKTTVTRNELDVNRHIAEYVALIDDLRTEITRLKRQLDSQVHPDSLGSAEAEESEAAGGSGGLAAGNGGGGGSGLKPQRPPGGTASQLSENGMGTSEGSRAGSAGLDRAFMQDVKEKVVENFRERMQLRRSLIELEDQNVQNSIEVGKRQLVIVQWNDACARSLSMAAASSAATAAASNGPEGAVDKAAVEGDDEEAAGALAEKAEGAGDGVVGEEGSGASGAIGGGGSHAANAEELLEGSSSLESLMSTAPEEVRAAWLECQQLRSAITKNNDVKRKIAKRLKSNERRAERFRADLTRRATGEERGQLMELQYRIGRLELDNMELEQSRVVHEAVLRGKDLTIQKLQLQLAVRDKVVERQRRALEEAGVDPALCSAGLQLCEQAAVHEDVGTPLIFPSPDPLACTPPMAAAAYARAVAFSAAATSAAAASAAALSSNACFEVSVDGGSNGGGTGGDNNSDAGDDSSDSPSVSPSRSPIRTWRGSGGEARGPVDHSWSPETARRGPTATAAAVAMAEAAAASVVRAFIGGRTTRPAPPAPGDESAANMEGELVSAAGNGGSSSVARGQHAPAAAGASNAAGNGGAGGAGSNDCGGAFVVGVRLPIGVKGFCQREQRSNPADTRRNTIVVAAQPPPNAAGNNQWQEPSVASGGGGWQQQGGPPERRWRGSDEDEASVGSTRSRRRGSGGGGGGHGRRDHHSYHHHQRRTPRGEYTFHAPPPPAPVPAAAAPGQGGASGVGNGGRNGERRGRRSSFDDSYTSAHAHSSGNSGGGNGNGNGGGGSSSRPRASSPLPHLHLKVHPMAIGSHANSGKASGSAAAGAAPTHGAGSLGGGGGGGSNAAAAAADVSERWRYDSSVHEPMTDLLEMSLGDNSPRGPPRLGSLVNLKAKLHLRQSSVGSLTSMARRGARVVAVGGSGNGGGDDL